MPNDLNNNPHLRNADARFLAGGENPQLYVLRSAALRVSPTDMQRNQQYAHQVAERATNEAWIWIAQNYAQEARAMQPTVDITGPPPRSVTSYLVGGTPHMDLSGYFR